MQRGRGRPPGPSWAVRMNTAELGSFDAARCGRVRSSDSKAASIRDPFCPEAAVRAVAARLLLLCLLLRSSWLTVEGERQVSAARVLHRQGGRAAVAVSVGVAGGVPEQQRRTVGYGRSRLSQVAQCSSGMIAPRECSSSSNGAVSAGDERALAHSALRKSGRLGRCQDRPDVRAYPADADLGKRRSRARHLYDRSVRSDESCESGRIRQSSATGFVALHHSADRVAGSAASADFPRRSSGSRRHVELDAPDASLSSTNHSASARLRSARSAGESDSGGSVRGLDRTRAARRGASQIGGADRANAAARATFATAAASR